MIIADLASIEGRRYPARRRTQNLVGGASPIQAKSFSMGHVTLDPEGGQVPWHVQDQEEVYFVIEGTGEMCLGTERTILSGGQAAYIPPGTYHQITNIGEKPLRMLYCYGPAGDVAHWRQELDGTLPRAGVEAPPLPEGARPQCTAKCTGPKIRWHSSGDASAIALLRSLDDILSHIASVARRALAAPRRSRCVTVFPDPCTKPD